MHKVNVVGLVVLVLVCVACAGGRGRREGATTEARPTVREAREAKAQQREQEREAKRQEAEQRRQQEEEAKRLARQKEEATAERVVVPDYLDDWRNRIAAEQRYKGRVVKLFGIVHKVDRSLTGSPYVILGAPGRLVGVKCNFRKEEVGKLANLSDRQGITVMGRCQGPHSLVDCVLVPNL